MGHFLVGPYDWGHASQPQDEAMLARRDHQVIYPRGKELGGSTMLNGMSYIRGHSEDYDEWEEELGNPGWGYRSILPHFKRSEDYVGSSGADGYHGTGGPMQVQDSVYRHPIEEIHLQGWMELGQRAGDVNGDLQDGGFFDNPALMQRNGWRQGTYRAFVEPLLDKAHLTVLTFATASEVVIDDAKIARGVKLQRFGKTLQYGATKEVILSAGAFGSPQILMLSGVGPRKHLEDDLGIEVREDLAVGKNLQDHLMADVVFKTEKAGLSASPFAPFNPWNLLQAFLLGSGPLLTNSANVNGMISTPVNEGSRPDIMVHALAFDLNADYGFFAKGILSVEEQSFQNYLEKLGHDRYGLLAQATLIRPRSRGILKLRSKDVSDLPILDFRFLDDPSDVKILVEGVKMIHQLSATEAFRSNGVEFIGADLHNCGGHQEYSHDYWECHVRHWLHPLFHAAGTCKMGPEGDPGAVVDHRLKVRGIGRLRVVDASVMPKLVGGSIMAPCMMIGEKGADMVIQEWGVAGGSSAEQKTTKQERGEEL